MSTQRRTVPLVLAGLALVAVVAGAAGAWYLFLRPAGPAPVAVSSLPPVATASPAASQAGTADPTGTAGASGTASASPAAGAGATGATGAIAGTWALDTSIGSFADFSSSFVGYRIREELASVGAAEAVGRTPAVDGSLTIEGTTLTATSVTADLTQLRSDDDRRDGQLARQGIETGRYPEATFELAAPVDLGAAPADGAEVSVDAAGRLTLHGVSREVTMPLTARLSGDVITVTGSVEIELADFDIAKPSSFLVLSIADTATMELQLYFRRA
jgi:polyisoprenoid-binding protein YceI